MPAVLPFALLLHLGLALGCASHPQAAALLVPAAPVVPEASAAPIEGPAEALPAPPLIWRGV